MRTRHGREREREVGVGRPLPPYARRRAVRRFSLPRLRPFSIPSLLTSSTAATWFSLVLGNRETVCVCERERSERLLLPLADATDRMREDVFASALSPLCVFSRYLIRAAGGAKEGKDGHHSEEEGG